MKNIDTLLFIIIVGFCPIVVTHCTSKEDVVPDASITETNHPIRIGDGSAQTWKNLRMTEIKDITPKGTPKSKKCLDFQGGNPVWVKCEDAKR